MHAMTALHTNAVPTTHNTLSSAVTAVTLESSESLETAFVSIDCNQSLFDVKSSLESRPVLTSKPMARTDDRIYVCKPFLFETVHYCQDGKNVPKARSGHRIVATDLDVYSFGGFNPSISESDTDMSDNSDWEVTRPLFRELWKFSYITRQWSKVQTCGRPPEELASHCAALIRERYLLVFGGTGVPFGQSSSNKLFVCDLKTKEWNLVKCDKYRDNTSTHPEEYDYPLEQYGQALTTDGSGNLFLVGGTTGFQYTIDIHKLDLTTRLWQNIYHKNNQYYLEFPQERYRHEVILYDNRLFVLGGGTSFGVYSLSAIPVFDLQTRQWVESQSKNDLNVIDANNGYPNDRRCHDCVRHNNCVFVLGGTDGTNVFNDFWRLDLNDLQWTKLWSDLPRGLYFHSAAISPMGRLSVFGGVTNVNHKDRTNELFTTWLTVPPLKEMAFEAVLFYVRKRSTNRVNEVFLELGLPSNISQRFK